MNKHVFFSLRWAHQTRSLGYHSTPAGECDAQFVSRTTRGIRISRHVYNTTQSRHIGSIPGPCSTAQHIHTPYTSHIITSVSWLQGILNSAGKRGLTLHVLIYLRKHKCFYIFLSFIAPGMVHVVDIACRGRQGHDYTTCLYGIRPLPGGISI